MDPLTASLLAAAVAWASILAVVHLPRGRLPIQQIRLVGGITIAALGAVVLGAPIPGWSPVLVMVAGGLFIVMRPAAAQGAPG